MGMTELTQRLQLIEKLKKLSYELSKSIKESELVEQEDYKFFKEGEDLIFLKGNFNILDSLQTKLKSRKDILTFENDMELEKQAEIWIKKCEDIHEEIYIERENIKNELEFWKDYRQNLEFFRFFYSQKIREFLFKLEQINKIYLMYKIRELMMNEDLMSIANRMINIIFKIESVEQENNKLKYFSKQIEIIYKNKIRITPFMTTKLAFFITNLFESTNNEIQILILTLKKIKVYKRFIRICKHMRVIKNELNIKTETITKDMIDEKRTQIILFEQIKDLKKIFKTEFLIFQKMSTKIFVENFEENIIKISKIFKILLENIDNRSNIKSFFSKYLNDEENGLFNLVCLFRFYFRNKSFAETVNMNYSDLIVKLDKIISGIKIDKKKSSNLKFLEIKLLKSFISDIFYNSKYLSTMIKKSEYKKEILKISEDSIFFKN